MFNSVASWAVLICVVLACFGLLGLGLCWIGMVWVSLGCLGSVWLGLAYFGLVWVGLGTFGLFWVGLGRFGLFRGRTAPSPQTEPPAQPPATPRHQSELGAHWPAPPSAHATLFVIGQIFSQSFTFRRSDSLRCGGGARLSPSGVGGVRVEELGALFPGAFRVTFPAAFLAAMEVSCQALRTTHQAREAVRTGGEGGRASLLRVAVAMSTGAGCYAHARGLCHGGPKGAEYDEQGQAWIPYSSSLNGSGEVGTAKEECPYSFLHSLLFRKATAVVPHSW